MENHHFTFKLSRLFPSSCQFRALPDVAQSTITISKTKIKPEKIAKKKNPTFAKHSKRRECPPLTPNSSLKPSKKIQERCKKNNGNSVSLINQSSTSNSGWFSSSDEADTFLSFNSTSGDSFRVKSSRRFLTFSEMKSIDENGTQSGTEDPGREKERSSFSSRTSFDTLLISPKPGPKQGKKHGNKQGKNNKKEIKGHKFSKYELGCDHISTQIYYSNASDSETSFRRRKTSRPRRRRMRRNKSSTVIEESYAVEKSSNDPRGDFRASMVEMIVEKQMFGAEDLDKLLKCYLSLNAVCYHGMIVDVFSEICETLFSN